MKYSVEAKQSDPVMDYVMMMLHAATQAHILHWKTPSRSDHEALNIFYEKVPSLLDKFVESFQGRFGKLHDYKPGFELPPEPLAFISAVCERIEVLRREKRFPQDSFLQNMVDEMVALCESTKYQLKELK